MFEIPTQLLLSCRTYSAAGIFQVGWVGGRVLPVREGEIKKKTRVRIVMNFRIQTLEKTRLVYVMLYGSLPQVSSFLTQLLQATESWAEAKLVTSRNG